MKKYFHPFTTVTFLIISSNVAVIESGMTVQQMEYAGKAIRDTCKPQFNVSDEIINGMKIGQFPENDDLKCFVNCVMELMLIMRNGAPNFTAAAKHIHLLPEDLREPYTNGMNACKNAADGVQGKCQIAYTLIKCTHKNNPVFMWP
ncbi:general odorant-binding protein 72-like [Bradysia coprophila]|uniref:general odorant-binding protein 72-like n=1 Tax=Bradysia coprophila TaxID=38358 RepID=UPI00187DC07D|nr:general odorant-binding protein 72-like [Bradysia coprophila]